MHIDPDIGDAVDDFVVVEDGDYLLRVAEIKETRDDDRTSWMLRLELVDGPLAGRTAVTDWLNFNERGMHRVRLVLGALGFDVSVPLDVDPDELVGLQAIVRLETQETRRRTDGRPQRRSRVPYHGWAPAGGRIDEPGAGHSSGAVPADAMPF